MPTLPTKVLLLVIFALISFSHAKLQIIFPNNLAKDKRFHQGIDYVVLTSQDQQFHKRSFQGNLRVPGLNNEKACEPYNNHYNIRNSESMIIVDWGECSLIQKVKNMHENMDQIYPGVIILVLGPKMRLDDSSLRNLPFEGRRDLTVVAITKKDGDNLLQVLREATSTIKLFYSYDPERNVHYNKEEYRAMIDFYFTVNDVSRSSYEFLFDFRDVLPSFGSSVKFTPQFGIRDDFGDRWSCLAGGRYCNAGTNYGNQPTGSDAVLETLRQICLRDMDDQANPNTHWWNYITPFRMECVQQHMHYQADCLPKVLKKISKRVLKKIDTCMRESFGASPDEDLLTTSKDNSKLKAQLEVFKKTELGYELPSLYVNGLKYDGALRDTSAVTEFVCSHFPENNLPWPCRSTLSHIATYLRLCFEFATFACFVAIVLYCVRRHLKRKAMSEAHEYQEVPNEVNQYQEIPDEISDTVIMVQCEQIPEEKSDSIIVNQDQETSSETSHSNKIPDELIVKENQEIQDEGSDSAAAEHSTDGESQRTEREKVESE